MGRFVVIETFDIYLRQDDHPVSLDHSLTVKIISQCQLLYYSVHRMTQEFTLAASLLM